MQIEVNGTRLWFDVEGPALDPDGHRMRNRPTLVLVHGGPGSYDHSYFKPFTRLADEFQVVYLDLRDHGRSARHDPADWSFELCADDLHAFFDTLGIERPVVLGHSMGGFVAMLYAARHPGHAGGLVLQSTSARFDLDRLVEGFRRHAGDEVAELARRDYGGDPVTDDEWARVFAAFGPHVPSTEELARRVRNPELGPTGMELLRRLEDQGSGVTRMSGGVEHCHEAAHRMTEDDWPLDAEGVAERVDIVGAELEAPVRRVVSGRAAMVTEVEIDDLELVGQPAEIRLEIGMVVAAGSAVDEDERRSLAHVVAVGDEGWPFDVEPQPCAVHFDLHWRSLCRKIFRGESSALAPSPGTRSLPAIDRRA